MISQASDSLPVRPTDTPATAGYGASGTGWQEVYLGGSPTAEAQLFAHFAAEMQALQRQQTARAGQAQPLRALHARQHVGLTNAEFRIAPDLPAGWCGGFWQPGARYRATVRFSNAAGGVQADSVRDLRGLAVRLHLADQPAAELGSEQDNSQDLLATSAPISHARDARQFMLAAQALAAQPRWQVPLRLIRGLGLREGWRTLRILLAGSSAPVDSLAHVQFWSRSAFAWGPYAVKYTFYPQATFNRAGTATRLRSAHYLREDLIQRLQTDALVYNFAVQRFVDENCTPIEDGTVEWREQDSPWITIAQLVILQQDLTTATARQIDTGVERLAFNVWHTPGDLHPLGSLNRVRKIVYPASSAYRLDRSEVRQPMSTLSRPALLIRLFRRINRIVPWHKLPLPLAILNLVAIRNELRTHNLYDTQITPCPTVAPPVAASLGQRTVSGADNDLACPHMGRVGERFGRNIPLTQAQPDANLLTPSPREISRRLLTRDAFIPVPSLNLLATAWLQFQTHDWFSHQRLVRAEARAEELIEIPLTQDDPWPEQPMVVTRTPRDSAEQDDPAHPPAYANSETHWWDGSQLYGSRPAIAARVRSFVAGKLTINANGLLPFDPATGIEITGMNENWWLGLSLLHSLFTLEHNAICDQMAAQYPAWDDEQLFHKARLINAALLAKIHTVEWTPAILAHPALKVAMQGNWWGLVGRRLHDLAARVSDNEAVRGILGSSTDHHGANFAMTEEFIAVYRMHPLVPDELRFFAHTDHRLLGEKTLPEVAGRQTHQVLDSFALPDLFYSFGHAHPGAITLHNYPRFLQQHTRVDGETIDLAALDILRDRERGIPRYNHFRQLFHLPRVPTFAALTDNPQWAAELRAVYNDDIDAVDLMVGMYAETPPRGFGFSDTAFRVFALMASRRLKSDRFFTRDYTPAVYTPTGIAWVEENDLRTVLLRHYPQLATALAGVENAFAPWRRG